MLQLIPMTIAEFEPYSRASIADYADQSRLSGLMSVAASLDEAADIFHSLLPQGIDTPQHYLYTLCNDETADTVGILWFSNIGEDNAQTAFLYDIAIYPPFQRRGYASEALQLLEQKIRDLNLKNISLNVFMDNAGAVALYRKAGFIASELTMIKPLKDD